LAPAAVLFTRQVNPLANPHLRSLIRHSVDVSEGLVLTLTTLQFGGAVAQLGARLDGIEEVVGSNPIGSTNLLSSFQSDSKNFKGH
jgi:hypothetical protein